MIDVSDIDNVDIITKMLNFILLLRCFHINISNTIH